MIPRLACVLIILLASLRIASTYTELTHTIDEPVHLACGLEWWVEHKYTFELQHPPLARIAAAFGPWMLGAPYLNKEDTAVRNPAILYESASYSRTLASARAGELPFFILAAVIVWLWARRLHGNLAAILAVLFFTTLPSVLAHAGLATTDMAISATLPAAVYAFLLWLDNPGRKQSILFGAALAAGLLSKFTFVVFFPVCAGVVLLIRVLLIRFEIPKDLGRRARSLLLALGVACFLIWSVFLLQSKPFPLAGVYFGLLEAYDHNNYGHLSFLMGQIRWFGWWYFFPVVFTYKTPLAFLILILVACRFLIRSPRQSWIPLACAAAMMISVLPTTINLGVRHILPIYPMVAIPAGFAAATLLRSPLLAVRIAAVALILWHVGSSARAHPDYIAYFNELARGAPEKIRVDSDLDWGQGILRLKKRLRERGITERIAIGWFGSTAPADHGLNVYRASPTEPASGWIAVSATALTLPERAHPDEPIRRPFRWLRGHQPVERIGGILLYYIQPTGR
jgi:hypothetical protein